MKTYPVYLNGELSQTAETFPVMNPATGERVAEMSSVGRPTVAKAIGDAAAAFGRWRTVPGRSRGEFLRSLANELQRRGEELTRLITLENGKPITQSQGEVALAVDHLNWFAEEASRGYGRVIPPQVVGKRHLVVKTPVGVVAAITPWNFPLMLAVRKVAPALAAGCAIVLKPARQTPLSASLFAECVHACGLPKGAFQLVAGSASVIGAEFLENPICRKITFTGSTEVGRELIAGAAAHVKALSLELGGLAPVLVFDDVNLKDAVRSVMTAKFRNTGQSCIAANRIFVQRGIYEAFVALLVEEVKALKVGDGSDRKVQIGPLIDEAGRTKAVQHVQDALSRGARLCCGGKSMSGRGFFFEPTVLADVPHGSLCLREETFAPIAPVCAFETEEEAIALANDTPFGLSAYAFTRDLGRTFRLAENLEAGIIGINDGLPTTSQAPFGGVKQSGWGRELGSEGMEAFLDTKHISIGL